MKSALKKLLRSPVPPVRCGTRIPTGAFARSGSIGPVFWTEQGGDPLPKRAGNWQKVSMDWFCWEHIYTGNHGFYHEICLGFPGFPVKIFPSNSMILTWYRWYEIYILVMWDGLVVWVWMGPLKELGLQTLRLTHVWLSFGGGFEHMTSQISKAWPYFYEIF